MSKFTTQDYYKLALHGAADNNTILEKNGNNIQYLTPPVKLDNIDKKIIARQHTQSGMDAMAVQDSEGKITIVYPGSKDFGDYGTDVQLTVNSSPDEFNDADNFFKEVSKHYNVKKKILKQLDIHLQVH